MNAFFHFIHDNLSDCSPVHSDLAKSNLSEKQWNLLLEGCCDNVEYDKECHLRCLSFIDDTDKKQRKDVIPNTGGAIAQRDSSTSHTSLLPKGRIFPRGKARGKKLLPRVSSASEKPPVSNQVVLDELCRSYCQREKQALEIERLRVANKKQGTILEQTQVALQHERATNLFLAQDLSNERAQRLELARQLHDAHELLNQAKIMLQSRNHVDTDTEPLWPHLGPADHDLEELSTSVGNYTLGQMLGEGYFGQVRLGVQTKNQDDQTSTETDVAIKVLKKDRLETTDDWKQLDLEVMILKNHGHHPNIIGMLDVLHAPQNIYLIMERGTLDLHTVVHETSITEQQPDWIQQVMRGIIEPLQYLHARGVCHLDIKPENVLILTTALDASSNNTKLLSGRRIEASDIRLCDFGLATVSKNYQGDSKGAPTIVDVDDVQELTEELDILQIGQTSGTPGFFAPEMIIHGGFEGRTADMWSVGCTLLEISFGYPRAWMDSYDYFNQDVEKFEQGLEECLEEIRCFYDIETDEEYLVYDLLLKYLLQMDVDKRATAAQTLKHPWFDYRHDKEENASIHTLWSC